MKITSITVLGALLSATVVARADVPAVRAPELTDGSAWVEFELEGAALPVVDAGFEHRVFWDLRPRGAAASRVRFTVLDPREAGLAAQAQSFGADHALCAVRLADAHDTALGCTLFRAEESGPEGIKARWPATRHGGLARDAALSVGSSYEADEVQGGRVTRIKGKAVAEGLALVPAGPRQVVLVREVLTEEEGPSTLRLRFLSHSGLEVARFEGALPAAGAVFIPERGKLLSELTPLANDGMKIHYPTLSQALDPGSTGFLQYSSEQPLPLTSIHPGWTSIAAMIAVDATAVPYQPDPGDPASLQTLPEVWDFTTLQTPSLDYRTFNTTRDDLGGAPCLQSCATRDLSAAPPDGTWQAYLKIDNFRPDGSYYTRDVFTLNDNDTGANPSIDVPYVAKDELNTSDRLQVCFQQSAGGAERFLHFFKFTGANPASAVIGVGDSWPSGNWTECDNTNGLRLTIASTCSSQCYPGCSAAASPRARGMLTGNAGFRATILDDGYVHVPPGNYVPALLMRQDTDILAGVDLFGVCNVSPTRNRSFDYFWIQERYGLLALVSSPTDTTGNLQPGDWSLVNNVTDGVDVTWGPYPPWQIEARACLAGTRIQWALPADGSNLEPAPAISNWGYVVSWGASADAEALANWSTNPNHTPLPGDPGYLVAPPGGEPTSTLITGWAGSSINATVVTALRYTDPDVGDTKSYRSAAFYKVTENPAKLNPATFVVGTGVDPFVTKSGANLQLAWPAVPGAASYRLRVWNLATRTEIACPAGLNCSPSGTSATHVGAGTSAAGYGYRAFAVDPCGAVSAD
jgi:hypothetical protein